MRLMRHLSFLFLPMWIIVPSPGVEAPDEAYRRVENLIIAKQYASAVEKLKEILEDEPESKLYNRALAYCFEKTWDFKSAAETYTKIIEAGEAGPDTKARLGVCLQRLNRFEEAIQHYKLALRGRLRLEGRVIALSGLAECHFRLGKEEKYTKYLEDLRCVSAKTARLIETRCLNQDKKYKEAHEILSKLYEQHNADAQIIYELAFSLLGQGRDYDFVEKLLEEIEPDSNIRRLDVDLLRCHLWLKRQEYRETMRARSKLEKATGLTPDEETYRDEIFKKIEETF